MQYTSLWTTIRPPGEEEIYEAELADPLQGKHLHVHISTTSSHKTTILIKIHMFLCLSPGLSHFTVIFLSIFSNIHHNFLALSFFSSPYVNRMHRLGVTCLEKSRYTCITIYQNSISWCILSISAIDLWSSDFMH